MCVGGSILQSVFRALNHLILGAKFDPILNAKKCFFPNSIPEQSLVLFYSLLLKFRINMVVLGVQLYTKKGIAILKTRIVIYIAIHLVKEK